MKTLIVLLALCIASPVLAQPARRSGPAPVLTQSRQERIKQRIRALRAYTLTEALQLDQPTAGKLFPLLAKFDEEFDKLLEQRADLQRRLEGSAQVTDPKQLDKLIDAAIANQRSMWETEEKRLGELRKILTPAQTARVLVVLPAMERKIQNQLRRAMRKAARAQKAGDDEDDEFGDDSFGNPPGAAPKGDPTRCDPFTSLHGCTGK
ncbi:MAG: hypothetical protein HOV81_12860 [Kofleriaceae bacterium]|nr:hypothetical protein [Kofleriaceae bacterium]